MTEQIIPRKPWVYDGEPLEELNTTPATEETAETKATYKTAPSLLKAIRKYEEGVKQDPNQLERRNHQKNYSGAKSFITYAAKIEELHFMQSLIEDVLKWSEDIEDFDQLRRPDRKQLYQKR